jgi:cysteinyl-tRNA synthetase
MPLATGRTLCRNRAQWCISLLAQRRHRCFSSPSAPTAGESVTSSAVETPVSIRNSVTGRLEPLLASSDGVLRWYNCGPTVYDHAHLGHARTYVCLDAMQRILRDVFHVPVLSVMGITDVDDKIVARARERRIPASRLARTFEAEFLQDLRSLGVELPPAITRVSEHVDDICAYIARIVDNGHAYAADDDSGVYFDTRSFGDAYGRLADDPTIREPREATHQTGSDGSREAAGAPADGAPGAERATTRPAKRDARDFALWKRVRADDETAFDACVTWDSEWGRGRPGWHIECSAMSRAVLGPTFDLHGGGVDLKFPHHCNEIAQSEAYLGGGPGCWVRQFVHTGHLHIDGLKMSKSLKNFVTVREMLEGRSGLLPGGPACPDAFRMWCLQHRYGSDVHFGAARLEEAGAVLAKFRRCFDAVRRGATLERTAAAAAAADASERGQDPNSQIPGRRWTAREARFHGELLAREAEARAALAEDFDTPRALGALSELARATNVYLAEPRPNVELAECAAARAHATLSAMGFSRAALGAPLSEPERDQRLGAGPFRTGTSAGDGPSGASAEPLREFRAVVRAAALAADKGDFGGLKAAVLSACDDARDHVLPRLAGSNAAAVGSEGRAEDLPAEQAMLRRRWAERRGDDRP